MESGNATVDDPFFNIHLEFRNETAYSSRADYNDPWPILHLLIMIACDIGSIYVLTILIRVLLKIERNNGTDRYLLHYALTTIIAKFLFSIMNCSRFLPRYSIYFIYVVFSAITVVMCLTILFVNLLALNWYVEFKNDRTHSICIVLVYVCGATLWILGILDLFHPQQMIHLGSYEVVEKVYIGVLVTTPVFVGTINLLGYRKGEQTESERYPLTVANYATFSWLFVTIFVVLMMLHQFFSQTLQEFFNIFAIFFMFMGWSAPIVIAWYLKEIERYREGFAEVLKTKQQKDDFLLHNVDDENV